MKSSVRTWCIWTDIDVTMLLYIYIASGSSPGLLSSCRHDHLGFVQKLFIPAPGVKACICCDEKASRVVLLGTYTDYSSHSLAELVTICIIHITHKIKYGISSSLMRGLGFALNLLPISNSYEQKPCSKILIPAIHVTILIMALELGMVKKYKCSYRFKEWIQGTEMISTVPIGNFTTIPVLVNPAPPWLTGAENLDTERVHMRVCHDPHPISES